MRIETTLAVLSAALVAGFAPADVVISMPPPPAPGTIGPETTPEREIELGELALARYRRPEAPDPTPDGGHGWWGGPWLGGGYRISLSPHHVYARRGWNGGYVYPGWYGWP